MSPLTYKRRLRSLVLEMETLYKASNKNPILGRSLLHVGRAVAVLDDRAMSFSEEREYQTGGTRFYIPRCIEILRKRKRPITLRQLMKILKERHPDLRDLQYRQFHPSLRSEIRKPNRRITEQASSNGLKMYGLPGWKNEISYVPGIKCGV